MPGTGSIDSWVRPLGQISWNLLVTNRRPIAFLHGTIVENQGEDLKRWRKNLGSRPGKNIIPSYFALQKIINQILFVAWVGGICGMEFYGADRCVAKLEIRNS